MQKYRYFIFLAGVVLTAVVYADIYAWIIISADKSRSFEEVKQIYLSRFPMSFRNPRLLTFIEALLLSIAAFLFFSTRHDKYLKLVSRILLGLDILITAWLLFTLM